MPTTKASTDVTRSSVHLDAIRGGAALIVLFGHTRGLFFPSLSGKQNVTAAGSTVQSPPMNRDVAQDKEITIGNEAVILFFVLSGYLVGGSVIKAISRNAWSWKSYLIKRMTRLWIVLIPALLLGVALDYTGLHYFSTPGSIYTEPPQQDMVRDVATELSLPTIAGNAIFLQSIVVGTAGTNDSLWSLANEFWYYIAFPVLLLALKKDQKLWLRCVYLLIAVGIVLFVNKSISLLFFIWALGAVLSIVPLKLHRGVAKIGSVLFAILLPIMFITIRHTSLSKYQGQWVVALTFTVALYLILHQTEKARQGIYHSIAGFFSRISYTLYLVHLPLAVFLCALINNPWHFWDKSPKHLAVFLGLNAFLVLFCYLFYRVFEANTDKVRNALFHRPMPEKHLPTSVANPN
jgi:peptidoglycan/LPS O-acetylase OafA/YrhL